MATEKENKTKNSLKIKLSHLDKISPLTENQKRFMTLYDQGSYACFLHGSPGTGKSFLIMYKALEEILQVGGFYQKLVIVRSAVQTRDQGFLPGKQQEKEEIYELPYVNICSRLFNRKDAYQRLKEQGYIEFMTTTAIRGITIDNAIIFFDEIASANFHELSTVISRTGYKSKIFFAGDVNQNDLIKNPRDKSGLPLFVRVSKMINDFDFVQFTPDDIVRSSLVKNWIIACESAGVSELLAV